MEGSQICLGWQFYKQCLIFKPSTHVHSYICTRLPLCLELPLCCPIGGVIIVGQSQHHCCLHYEFKVQPHQKAEETIEFATVLSDQRCYYCWPKSVLPLHYEFKRQLHQKAEGTIWLPQYFLFRGVIVFAIDQEHHYLHQPKGQSHRTPEETIDCHYIFWSKMSLFLP